MADLKAKVGVVGCGNISGVYIKRSKIFSAFEIVACADVIMERAKAKAAEFNIPKVCTVEELLADPEIAIVLNLTIPKAHGEIALAALKAGKSVYNEKPLAVTREEAKKMADLAKAKKLRIGCAPDTFLGAGLQTCRKLIADGWIGKPVAATAFMMGHGPENWHPDPETFYQPGAGPMFDMGPYYLTALVNLIGPVKRVTSCAKITFPERTIGSQPKAGTRFKVNTPTHVVGIMEFAGGAVGSIITSFDVWASNLPCIEIYGTAGTLSCPDPNTSAGRARTSGARCRSATGTPSSRAAWAWRTWPSASAPAGRTAPAASWPTTSSTSCSPSSTPRRRAGRWRWAARASSPRRCRWGWWTALWTSNEDLR
jgi:predicted dehydrogenase